MLYVGYGSAFAMYKLGLYYHKIECSYKKARQYYFMALENADQLDECMLIIIVNAICQVAVEFDRHTELNA